MPSRYSSAPRPVRVLIVEDQHLAMADLKLLVHQSRGEVAATFRNLAEFRTGWPVVDADLAIVDLKLGRQAGNRDGWMIATEINSSERPMPILICSGYNDQEMWRQVPRHKYVLPMAKDASLSQYLMLAYPLLHRFYPDAERMFTFHPGGASPQAVNDAEGDKMLVKNSELGYAQVVDPRRVPLVQAMKGGKIKIYYEDQQILFSQSLAGYLTAARNPRMLQVNRSQLVNYDYIHGRDRDSVYVRTYGRIVQVTIGGQYAEAVAGWWRWLRSPGR